MTTEGVSAKAWIRKDGELYLYKGDKNDSIRKEVEASIALRRLGIPVLSYKYGEWKSQKVSVSKCYTSESVASVMVEDFRNCSRER